MDHGLCARALQLAAGLGTLCCLLLVPGLAAAQLPLEPSGLRGGRHVGSAGAVPDGARLTLGLKYAYTEGVLGAGDSHQRAAAELGVAYTPYRFLQLALTTEARYDAHRGDFGRDRGGAFASALVTRHALALTRYLALGAQVRLKFPAAASLVRGLRALSPELALLSTARLPAGIEASLLAGYRFDRSIHSVADPARLSAADRLATELSRFDAALLGLLFSMPLGPVMTSLEGSLDLAVGAESPPVGESPLRVRLAAQLPLGRRYVVGGEVGASPSARPPPSALARIEPRVWMALGMAVLFEQPETAPRPVPSPPPLPPPAEHEPVRLAVRVVDPTGAPLTGAHVVLASDGETLEAATDGDGRARLTLGAPTSRRLTVAQTGYHTHEEALASAGEERSMAVTVTLTPDLPDGEIKGKVRSLKRGRPLRARITVAPLGTVLETDESGDFSIAVPPGAYTLSIEADGHEPQERPARVEHLGVTILVIDLRKARP